jgi:hypothetical protein
MSYLLKIYDEKSGALMIASPLTETQMKKVKDVLDELTYRKDPIMIVACEKWSCPVNRDPGWECSGKKCPDWNPHEIPLSEIPEETLLFIRTGVLIA